MTVKELIEKLKEASDMNAEVFVVNSINHTIYDTFNAHVDFEETDDYEEEVFVINI